MLWVLIHYDWCPYKRGRDTAIDKGRTLCKDKGRDWSDVSISQGMPQIASHHQKLEERHRTDFPSESSEEINSGDPLILDF